MLGQANIEEAALDVLHRLLQYRLVQQQAVVPDAGNHPCHVIIEFRIDPRAQYVRQGHAIFYLLVKTRIGMALIMPIVGNHPLHRLTQKSDITGFNPQLAIDAKRHMTDGSCRLSCTFFAAAPALPADKGKARTKAAAPCRDSGCPAVS